MKLFPKFPLLFFVSSSKIAQRSNLNNGSKYSPLPGNIATKTKILRTDVYKKI